MCMIVHYVIITKATPLTDSLKRWAIFEWDEHTHVHVYDNYVYMQCMYTCT